MSKKLSHKQIQHLYWRAGFGIRYDELREVGGMGKAEIVNRLFEKSTAFSPLLLEMPDVGVQDKKAVRRLRNDKMFELNNNWFEKMVNTESVLREKMVLFFQDHFSVRLKFPKACQELNNVIREHALGSFADMLMQVSKTPVMIGFLNNKQNRKSHPNENFAREVMELFTLGQGNGYTENDIKEAARAFTGWSFDKDGKFVFRARVHDDGIKTVLGSTGNFKGEDIINILLKKKQTALYLTEKIYRYLVNDIVDKTRVGQLADSFYQSKYDIAALLKEVFVSDWFYEERHIGVKIKSPATLLVGLSRQFYVKYNEPKTLLFIQRKLNQILFFPPNVAGWPGGKSWIDSSTLMLRLKLPSVILNDGVIEWHDKGDMPEEVLMRIQKSNSKVKSQVAKRVNANPSWKRFFDTFTLKDKEAIAEFLIQPRLSDGAIGVTRGLSHLGDKDFVVSVLSLPEYQLC